MKNIDELIKELREYRRIKEDAESQIESLQDEIKSAMSERNADTLTGPDWRITWKSVTSVRLDGKALKAAYPDIVAQFTKPSVSRRFVLT